MAKDETRNDTYPARTDDTPPARPVKITALNTVALPEDEKPVHSLGNNRVCDTESRGHATPQGRSTAEIVLDATEGFIPLWAPKVMLRWRFNEPSLSAFVDPNALKAAVRDVFAAALLAWGDAAPVRFTEDADVWDFEIIVRPSNQCSVNGCTLARAFFPDAGRHDLTIFPIMFDQSRQEQVDTLTHEIGHVFGLRHFFAPVSEAGSPSVIFGTHNKFSIMNYGELSTLTDADKADLKQLYAQVWSGARSDINGTPIRLVQPFHTLKPQSLLTVTRPTDEYVPVAALVG